ncbi:uncharacterized protein DUF3397 [Sinobaca qinghaiensis]|uniref:Uncharacterized protein DUF3397 n=1 Tax=Sinobaca qinghaiensis TaxID=342944 RepID=A0A419V675_9BACL|nr:DUF3397 domain-containing protein [Sinobaca qinghaiensis]RKD75459.1 uncharacterized protein DUF3397 [Sinobaca qinghaiensis]
MQIFIDAIVGTLLLLPFLAWYILYLIQAKITKKKRKSMRRASEFSFLFFAASIYFYAQLLWGVSVLWIIFLIVLVIGIIVLILHRKYRLDMEFPKIIKSMMRFSFAVFFSVYVLMLIYGLIDYFFIV